MSLCGLAKPIAAHYNAAHAGTVDWSLMVAGIVIARYRQDLRTDL